MSAAEYGRVHRSACPLERELEHTHTHTLIPQSRAARPPRGVVQVADHSRPHLAAAQVGQLEVATEVATEVAIEVAIEVATEVAMATQRVAARPAARVVAQVAQ